MSYNYVHYRIICILKLCVLVNSIMCIIFKIICIIYNYTFYVIMCVYNIENEIIIRVV